ncbi:50S ribosomal protein L17 [candidate division WWE3 bacterium CG08_land_8_20_14_0_20_43_13]|uniref:50S ribosomal protein L17 n=1 Tax=candidate division WWE3 bacterium CG08_land_8_20_14_0_20_43_13 TaxID=1975087 RepID=A0A2H0X7D6_UNCKA|nr:MAG: 50S ribosomal protein L17 [candidate division WWE3 bacterium CG08_land_8_20_14_0_20_43_13]
MRHRVKRLKLNKQRDHLKAMRRNMASSFFIRGYLETTGAKARMIRPVVEKLITKAKQQGLYQCRELLTFLNNKESFSNLWEKIVPLFINRSGGYTRLIRLNFRKGDSAEMARLELIDNPIKKVFDQPTAKKSENKSGKVQETLENQS